MNVGIKSFDVDMAIKTKGIELEVRTASGEFIGDLVITKTKLIWCEGRTTRDRGKAITWEDFRTFMLEGPRK